MREAERVTALGWLADLELNVVLLSYIAKYGVPRIEEMAAHGPRDDILRSLAFLHRSGFVNRDIESMRITAKGRRILTRIKLGDRTT